MKSNYNQNKERVNSHKLSMFKNSLIGSGIMLKELVWFNLGSKSYRKWTL